MVALIITLIIISLVLWIVELVVIPGFGVAGILGVVSLILSCCLAFTHFGPTAGAITTAAGILLVIIATIMVLRSRTWKKVSLNTSIDSKVDSSPKEKGVEIGQKGTAVTRLAPGGDVRLNGNVMEAFARDAIIENGSSVEVVDIEDNKIIVKEI